MTHRCSTACKKKKKKEMLFISLINQVEIIYSSETHHVQDNKHSGHRVPPQEDTQSDAEKTHFSN